MNYTELSREELKKVADNNYSPARALDYLKNAFLPRRFSGTLTERHTAEEVKTRLSEFLRRYSTASKDSTDKKIRDWLSDRYTPADREDYFRIAFALEQTETEANRMLALHSDFGIHYRNPREIVMAHCLRNPHTYDEALALAANAESAYKANAGALPQDGGCPDVMTQKIYNELLGITDDGKLLGFISENAPSLGYFHNSAYKFFADRINVLIDPTQEQSDSYSIERVVGDYMRMHVPLERGTSSFDSLQKIIKSQWPNTTLIKNIYNRKVDVSRKIVILLYLITDGLDLSLSYDELDEDYITPDERLEEHCWRLNMMLHSCEMNIIDPRNAFDWLVLYSLRAEYDESMSERMESVLGVLFGAQN